MIQITKDPILAQPLIDRVNKNNEAVVTFIGTVRNNADGKKVLYLEYEAFSEMAQKKLEEIAAEIRNRWKITDIEIVHRIGRIEIGENVVVIAIGSVNRSEALQACQYAIDRIKEVVPIWKKEFYEDSSNWIGHA
jgi:molybdopterin synthase catalytic subunit